MGHQDSAGRCIAAHSLPTLLPVARVPIFASPPQARVHPHQLPLGMQLLDRGVFPAHPSALVPGRVVPQGPVPVRSRLTRRNDRSGLNQLMPMQRPLMRMRQQLVRSRS